MSFEKPSNKPNMSKDFSELVEKGIVTITTDFGKTKLNPQGYITIERWQLVFQRVASGENSEIGTKNDITYDYLDDDTKNLLIVSVQSGKEVGQLNIPGATDVDGTRVNWMLKLIREPSKE